MYIHVHVHVQSIVEYAECVFFLQIDRYLDMFAWNYLHSKSHLHYMVLSNDLQIKWKCDFR